MRRLLPGQIYHYVAAERGGPRPVLVVSREELNRGGTVLIVPFTSQRLDERREAANCVPFDAGEFGLTKDCVAQTEQMAATLVSELDTAQLIGALSHDRLEEVWQAILYTLAIPTNLG